jgi:DNA-binding NarL/FixJ family response regulator
LVDRFDRDGRRYVVARRNEAAPQSRFELTQRERQILGYLLRGESAKATALDLGLAPSSVSDTTQQLLLKLGVRSVVELMRLRATTTDAL